MLIDRDAIAEYGELNDRTLYDGSSLSQVLQRIPLLVDTQPMSVIEDAEDWNWRHKQTAAPPQLTSYQKIPWEGQVGMIGHFFSWRMRRLYWRALSRSSG